MKLPSPSLEVAVADHCNLKCKNCSHFSPAFQSSFYDFEEYCRDLSALRSYYFPKRIRFLGGEPLLHPDIARFAQFAKSVGACKETVLVTNGLLLNRVPPETFAHFDRVHVSVYTSVKLDFVKQLETFKNRLSDRCFIFEIRHASDVHSRDLNEAERESYTNFREAMLRLAEGRVRKLDGTKVQEDFPNLPGKPLIFSLKYEDRFRKLTPDTELSFEEAKTSFNNCRMKVQCHSIQRGYFYKCPRPQNMHMLAATAPRGETAYRVDGIALHESGLDMRLKNYLVESKVLESCAWCLEGLPSAFEAHQQLRAIQ